MTIIRRNIAISAESMKRARQKVKELTRRGTHLPLEKTVDRINQWYTGWAGYYLMTQYPYQLRLIEARIRRRLRARFVYQQKRRRHLYKRLLKHGVTKKTARKTSFSNKGIWALSGSYALNRAFPNEKFLRDWGLKVRSTDKLKHWFSIKRRVVVK